MQVAIDGPAGSGKSTVCKILAKKYNLIYLDTGAMYRAAAWLKVKYPDQDLIKILENTDFIFSDSGSKLSLKIDNQLIDVSSDIRSLEISKLVSQTASNKEVRKILTEKQREYAKNSDVIMEGRDITTVVLPHADIKVFLTATAEERALRRYNEIKDKNTNSNYDEILKNIKERDNIDSNRDCAPLKQSADASLLDTTSKTLDEVADILGKMIEEKRALH